MDGKLSLCHYIVAVFSESAYQKKYANAWPRGWKHRYIAVAGRIGCIETYLFNLLSFHCKD